MKRPSRLVVLASIALLCAALVRCHARPGTWGPRPSLDELGALYVYLEPSPQTAHRLSFEIESVDAVADNGAAGSPLGIKLSRIEGPSAGEERLLAVGELPPGLYAGLALRVKGASVMGEQGRSDLAAPDDPVRVETSFTIVRRRALVLRLSLDERASLASGFAFTPVFAATTPGAIATGALGLAVDRTGNTVVFFDKITGQVVAVVPTGTEPQGLALDQARRRAFVAASGDDAVEMIDLQETAVTDRVRLTGGDRPVDLALTPDRSTLLAVASGSNAVIFMDARSLTVTDRVQVGNEPASILIDRQGRRAFVFNTLSDSISVLDLSTRSVVATIGTDARPLRGQFDRSGSKMYVIHGSSPYLAIFDLASMSVPRRVAIGAQATALKVDPVSDRVYVARSGGFAIDVYDPQSLLPVEGIPVTGDVSFLAYDGEQRNLCLALGGQGRVRCVRSVGGKTATEIDVGGEPVRIALMGER